MRNELDDRFWAENHQLLSDGIDRGFRRLGRLLRRGLNQLVPPDSSEEARKRNYSIG